ncbi:hypothetical protein RMATCC62417_10457 [Rhizopus microsporus]|nr:hypothetical protein RMATCC62417_10457 [Rhizopus microsporus]
MGVFIFDHRRIYFPERVYNSPIDDKTFNTARDHLIFFMLPATIRKVKDEFKIEADKPFKAVDARGKLRAVELLEQTAAPFVPLCACVGSWGGRLMLHDEKKSSATPSSVQDLHPPSSPVEESDSSGERKMTKKAN